MIIPLDKISGETLLAIIEEFILREGTDYGDENICNATKIAQVKQQLEFGSAVLVYSELYETVNIVPSEQLQQGVEEQT
ncbi:YheU family protein [Colwelliaceae bacterium MEBiC 14330]